MKPVSRLTTDNSRISTSNKHIVSVQEPLSCNIVFDDMFFKVNERSEDTCIGQNDCFFNAFF